MYRYKDHVNIPIIHRRGFEKSYKEIDRSLPVLSKLHLDVMISIDTIIFKQGVQHLNLVWFLLYLASVRSYLEKWKAVTLQEYSTSGMYILFVVFPIKRNSRGEHPAAL